MPEPDPRSQPEDEGIPDLQQGTPERQWAVDPEEMPIPGDAPVGVDEFGTTAEEQREGEPLDGRLAREAPEPQPILDAPPGAPAAASAPAADAAAGRLVAPDEGAHPDAEPDAVASEIGPDGGGYSAEETAMRVTPE